MKIGLTGGIGCGKSTVRKIFAEHEYLTANADEFGHECYRQENIVAAMIQRWGRDIVDNNGTLARKKVAEIVFQNSSEMDFLNKICMPFIDQKIDDFLMNESLSSSPILLEIPLLFERQLQNRFDVIVSVWSDRNTIEQRLAGRGLDSIQIQQRLTAQWSADVKLELADFGLINIGSMELLEQQCFELHRLFA